MLSDYHFYLKRTTKYGFIRNAIIACFSVATIAGCSNVFGPQNYDNCILENMRGVTSDLAAVSIRNSCREKFPAGSETQAKSKDLSPSEAASITGRAGLSFSNRFSGSAYNGNKDITITQLSVNVDTKIGGNAVSRVYVAEVTIPPLSARDFGFDIVVGDRDAEYSWSIQGAKGY